MPSDQKPIFPISRQIAGASFLAIVCFVATIWFTRLNDAPRHTTDAPRHTTDAPRPTTALDAEQTPSESAAPLSPRQHIDPSGFGTILAAADGWSTNATLAEVSAHWSGVAERTLADLDHELSASNRVDDFTLMTSKVSCYMSLGKPEAAYSVLQEFREAAESGSGESRQRTLATLMYLQGVVALRRGENENCILCRGDSSCIIPINPAAIHQHPDGSRQAIQHFTEYLAEFPDDLEARWLLNIAHMTLGEHPDGVDPRHVIQLDKFRNSEANIGQFRDIGHLVGLNRFNQAGGALMEDFDNDGWLDIATTTFDSTLPMEIFQNTGAGKFQPVSTSAGVSEQLGGLSLTQTDYNNDGLMDIFIPRGAWYHTPVRPSLLRNEGECRFTDVTAEAGLLAPMNSNAGMWADYDNDGLVDLFICGEQQPNRLYRNLGNGKFEDATKISGINMDGESYTKGCAWIDYDNDHYPDLFKNHLSGVAQLYHNNRDGKFINVTRRMGIDGPHLGFSCWAWDYDNDGWLDIFATCYDRKLGDIVKGLIGEPHGLSSNRLFRNLQGKKFQDVTKEAGLDMVFAAMGSNYGDFDNDGYLDMYLGTGEPDVGTLVPNRMFKNMTGRRFVEITGSARVGHLQKGHGIACGDWDRDGNIDIFAEMGGAVDGDRYHNILFQNPGHDNSWLTVKLIGMRTNRAALGARIKVVTAGNPPLTIYRHVSPGSSFGSSPLEQTIGLAKAERIAELEIQWPTSETTQVFHDIAVNQSISVTEFESDYKKLDRSPIPVPQ